MLEPEGSDYWNTSTNTQVEFSLWSGGLVSAINRLLVNLDSEYSEYSGTIARNEKLVRAENWDAISTTQKLYLLISLRKFLRN